MTAATIRAAIATATSTVAGVTCSPYFRQSTKPGDAFVRLDRSTRSDNSFGFMNTWQVMVVLSQDLASAEKWVDGKTSELVNAIQRELIVRSVIPQQLVTDGGTIPVLIIEGTRAADD